MISMNGKITRKQAGFILTSELFLTTTLVLGLVLGGVCLRHSCRTTAARQSPYRILIQSKDAFNLLNEWLYFASKCSLIFLEKGKFASQ